ncbi:glycosyltransferase 61 family protein [Hyphomicrobium sp. 802]|uniref:glycosyltransferase 61 family protein n=1 Tax=Hyphomicrobium sp. 802 TaxID=1112272 RepID=UPI0012DDCCEF|nr:glycosyltransferase 61 family protein [Hyphomicrobium sp. 802]
MQISDWAILSDNMDLISNHRAVDNLVRQAKAQFKNNDYLASAVSLQGAAETAWHKHAGMFFSAEIESLLVEMAKKITPFRARQAKQAGGPERVLHVLTQGYNIGGHTRLVWRWIEKDSSRQHSVVLTQQGEWPKPHCLDMAASKSGGKLVLLECSKNLLQLAQELRDIGEQFDYIVLHQHPFDVVPFLAWGSGIDRPPIIHFNHADHVFWIGASLVDINAEYRASGQKISIARRGLGDRQIMRLPIPLPNPLTRLRSKAEAKVQLGIPADDFLALTVASELKFHPIHAFDYARVHGPLLGRCEKLRFLVVGPSPHADYWKNLYASSGGRIQAVGTQGSTDVYLEAADIYLDSTPIGSLTSMLEAALAGIACVSWRPYKPEAPEAVLACDDIAFGSLPITFNEYGPYLDHVETCLNNASFAANISAALQAAVIQEHSGAKWLKALELVYSAAKVEALARPHQPDESRIGGPAEYDEILLRTQGGFVDVGEKPHRRDDGGGRLRRSLSKRKYTFKRSITKRLLRLAERNKIKRLPFRFFTPPQMQLDTALSLMRLSESGGVVAYCEAAYQLLGEVDEHSARELPLSTLEKILRCFAANGDHKRISAIASDILRRSPVLPPASEGLAVASALIDVDADAKADKLFAGWRSIAPKLFGDRHLSGAFKLRTLFPEHLSRSEPGGTCSFQLPSINGEPRLDRDTLPLPYDGCKILENAAVAGFDTIVDSSNHIVVYDLAGHPRYPHVAGHDGLLKGARRRSDQAILHFPYERVIKLPSAVHLAGRCSWNYFHWLVEYLPRLLNAIEGGPDRNVPVLIPDNLPNSMMRALEIVNSGRFQTFIVPASTALEVERLFIPSMHTFIVDGLAAPLRSIGAMSRRHMQFLRQRILEALPPAPASKFPTKIFLSRGNRPRSITNEVEIQEMLMRDGFTAVDTATMSFDDQVCLFRNAEILVGATSAAFANILFCEREPIVLSLISAHISDFNIYSNLLQVAGGGVFSHVLGTPIEGRMTSTDDERYMHVNFTVRAEDVRATLQACKALSGNRDRFRLSHAV